jgi:hypothetical protein
MESNGKVEFMAVTSVAGGGVGAYTYTVTRDLDGTGRNLWYAGDAVLNTGTTGNGFIDIYSVRGVKAGTEIGPTIVGNVRTGTTYNQWVSAWAVGNLNGLYGYGANHVYGAAFGKYGTGVASSFLTADATNGIRMMARSAGDADTMMAQWDKDGNILIGEATKGNTYISAGVVKIRYGVNEAIVLTNTEARFDNLIKVYGASGAISLGVVDADPHLALPTSAAAGTGIWLDRTGMYGLAHNVLQATFSATTGAITAGAGNVLLNSDGISTVGEYGHAELKGAYRIATSGTNIMSLHAYTTGLGTAPSPYVTEIFMDMTYVAGGAGSPYTQFNMTVDTATPFVATKTGVSVSSISVGTTGAAAGAIKAAAGITSDGHMLWTTDNTYDIGASGATRARDLFLGRNAVITGGLNVNTTGAAAGEIKTAGNVGIRMAPTYTLDITGADVAESGLRVGTAGYTNLPATVGVTDGIILNARGLNVVADAATLGTGPTVGVGIAINRAGPALVIKNVHASGYALLVEAGNVGIGGTPEAALTTYGNATVRSNPNVSGLFSVSALYAALVIGSENGNTPYIGAEDGVGGGHTDAVALSFRFNHVQKMMLDATGVKVTSGYSGGTVGALDDYDDALVLRDGMSLADPRPLIEVGALAKQSDGQLFWDIDRTIMLLGGGIYQGRQQMDRDRAENMSRLAALEAEVAGIKAKLAA